ncbi:sugar phosphate nucleotidyltransferase [Magnetospira sp. QH-2]|uniref:sugar phosphate nucleotidyltransferase n=1 Tax=Magnetospira sp. (strain QH-2) TaxID=1288970 RepID=UPI0003E811A3|nr:sugar phosphate nucleotidyltransferase [Magnetospira sp. QH-2]CCQ73093.1 conserved protein of unknown function [Magnetospira sp. QH-2]
MQIAFLVGGLGTRLGDLTARTPKPLLPVGETPFIEILMSWAATAGMTDILLLAGHMGDQLSARYDGARMGDATIRVAIENQPAGTGGALLAAEDLLTEHFVLANGDSLFHVDLAAFVAPPLNNNLLGRLALRRLEDTGRSGVVDLQGERITGFRHRGLPGEPGLINGGLYLLRKELLQPIRGDFGLPCSLEQDLFPVLARDRFLSGRLLDGFFLDIGIPEDYARAQTSLPAQSTLHLRKAQC